MLVHMDCALHDTVHLFPVQVLMGKCVRCVCFTVTGFQKGVYRLCLLCYYGILIKIRQAIQTSLIVVE